MRTSSNDGVVLARDPAHDFADLTGGRPPVKRRQLGGVVIATVAGCALILVAAAITRVGHASSAARAMPASAEAPASTAGGGATPAADSDHAAKVEPTPEPAPTTGTLRLERPQILSRVTVDGKKLASASESMSCGKHQVKVTGWRAHPIDIPCGGELVLAH
jgi:hypothetical protein